MKNRQKICLVLVIFWVVFCFLGLDQPQEAFHAVPTIPQNNNESMVSLASKYHYTSLTKEQIFALLDDPRDLIPSLFEVPLPLQSMVGFWLLIYAKYSLYQTLIYDRMVPSHIYEVIDTVDLFQRGLTPVQIELETKKRIKVAWTLYDRAFQKLILNPRKNYPAYSIEAKLIGFYGKISRKEWKNIRNNMRRQAGQRDRTMQGVLAADPFFPAMEAIFKRLNLPAELSRIPLVESSFNLKAFSKAKARGVWQFMERSAQPYLVVDKKNKIDERVSPIKSAYAAAKMFQLNKKILGDWGLAIIAYNHGIKNLIPIAKKYKEQKIADLLTQTKGSPLGYASRNYYAEFLAMLIAEKYRDLLYEIPKQDYPDVISIVRLKKKTSVFELASFYNLSLHELRMYNPDIFNYQTKLPVGTRLVLPRITSENVLVAPLVKRDLASPPVEFIEYIR